MAAAAAVAVLTVGTGWALAGDAEPSPRPEPPVAAAPEADGPPATYDADGGLVVHPDAEVHRRIENPFGFEPATGQVSDALDLTWQGQRTWVVLEGDPQDHSTLTAGPGGAWATFEEYVDAKATRDGLPWPELVELDSARRVVAASGASIAEQTDDPRLGGSFAPPETLQGAAIVAAEDEYTYFVVWREAAPGTLDVIPVVAGTGADLDTMLAWAREMYASGVGLR